VIDMGGSLRAMCLYNLEMTFVVQKCTVRVNPSI
jgi:hypothetical protein